VLGLIRDDLLKLKEKYGDARRTQIVPGMDTDFDIEDLITDENVFVRRRGYIKRTPISAYRQARRQG
jgi:DNA gyrase subunit A